MNAKNEVQFYASSHSATLYAVIGGSQCLVWVSGRTWKDVKAVTTESLRKSGFLPVIPSYVDDTIKRPEWTARVRAPKAKVTPLWVFNWNEGGSNQVYAATKREAITEIARMFPSNGPCALTPALKTLKSIRNQKAQTRYFNSLPLMD